MPLVCGGRARNSSPQLRIWIGGGLTNTVKAVGSTLYKKRGLKLGQHDSLLRLIFPFTVGVAGFTDLVGLEEDDLAEAFVGIDACRKWSGIGDFQRSEEHTSELQSHSFISYAVFCLKKK